MFKEEVFLIRLRPPRIALPCPLPEGRAVLKKRPFAIGEGFLTQWQ
jgi:hypothetical protein